MDIDLIEFYKGEKKAIAYDMHIGSEGFVPDTVTISIYKDNILKFSGNCLIANNRISFILTTDVTNIIGIYKGVYEITKGNEIHYKKIDISVLDL